MHTHACHSKQVTLYLETEDVARFDIQVHNTRPGTDMHGVW